MYLNEISDVMVWSVYNNIYILDMYTRKIRNFMSLADMRKSGKLYLKYNSYVTVVKFGFQYIYSSRIRKCAIHPEFQYGGHFPRWPPYDSFYGLNRGIYVEKVPYLDT